MKRTAPGLQTLHDAFDYQAATDRDSTACVCRAGDRCLLSYAAVCDRSKVLSKGLASLLGSRPPPTPPLITSVNAAGASTPPAPALVAVQLPRTHPDFVPLLLALSRTGLCFVLLSTDLLEKRLEEDRNALAFRLLQPWLCVRASASSDVSTGCATCLTVTAAQLAHQGTAAEQPSGFSTLSSQPLLCLLFTGGTQRTKIVQVTHAMFLHERVAYKEVWQPRDGQARVLAHTSVYWGASALGQLSIALAYGGCAVWTEATELAELHRCILEERITVLGLVPDLLDMLAPESPARELPGVDLVLTWGERLPRRVAERWRGHPRAVLRELLISTEYWLALFADPLGDAVLHTVSGCDLAVLKDDGNIADLDEVGELCIAGPMVTTGYSVAGDGTAHSDVFRIVGERNFFRTHDLVRLVKGGVLYKGRADMMAKSKGKWVDMFAIEGDLQQLPGVRAARVLADPHSENFHAFVAFDSCVPPAEAIAAARVVLPPQAQLRITPGLPRHPVTRKVNDIRLLESLKWPAPSWPIELAGCSRSADKVATLHVRLREKAQRQLVWTLATFTALLTVADAETLLVQFKLAGLWLIALLGVTRDGTGLRCSFRGVVVTALWALAALAVRPSWSKMRHCLFSVTTFPFVYLALVHADDVRHHGVASAARLKVARLIMALVDGVPFLKVGTFAVLSLAGHLWPNPLAVLSRSLFFTLLAYGTAAAARRGRLIAWPVVLSLCIGNQLEIECGAWLRRETWIWEVTHRISWLWDVATLPWRAGVGSLQHSGRASKLRLSSSVHESTSSGPHEEHRHGGSWRQQGRYCSFCNVRVDFTAWPTLDAEGNPLCNACGDREATEEARKASEWLLDALRALPPKHSADAENANGSSNSAEPVSKRRRLDSCENGGTTWNSNTFATRAHAKDLVEWNDENQRQYRRFEGWWWRNHVEDKFDLDADEQRRAKERLDACASHAAHSSDQDLTPDRSLEGASAELRQLCAIVAEVVPLLIPVGPSTTITGLDSLATARLSTVLRARLGRGIGVARLRSVGSVAQLAEVLSETPADSETSEKCSTSSPEREYSVWFTPGQHSPMGTWVLRSDKPIDLLALRLATQALVERHPALRTAIVEPLHFLSVVYDGGVLWTLYGPLLGTCRIPFVKSMQKFISKCFIHAWPHVRCFSRDELYGLRFPESAVPLVVLQDDSEGRPLQGQSRLEREITSRRNSMKPPFALTVYELTCHLVDVWVVNEGLNRGRFTIMRCPEKHSGAIADEADLFYVDIASDEWGPLLSPMSSRWQTPPYGFPALYFVPLSSGAIAWVRMENADELRICYSRKLDEVRARSWHYAAFRAAPERGREAGGDPIVIQFVGLSMFHAFADGNCYLPLAQDLLTFYDAICAGSRANLPPLDCHDSFDILQRRLHDTLSLRTVPTKVSLRGSIFWHRGYGYAHTLCLESGVVSVLTYAALRYRIPLDVLILGLVVCSQARADESELIEFTLYVPMRDGAAEPLMVGLFADWRDVAVGVDSELNTLLGTVLQLYDTIQNRRWTVFNALRKPDVSLINVQPLDVERRSHFHHLGENLWHGGDQLGKPPKLRSDDMEFGRQPLTFNIEQQDATMWWIMMDVGYEQRPAPWLRRFVVCFREALQDLIYDPFGLVHKPLPDIEALTCIENGFVSPSE